MKILVIEDDDFFRNFFSNKLKENGFETETASDGVEGLEKINTFTPDLIFLDLIMPKLDGFEVLNKIMGNPKARQIPVFVFSSLGQESDIEKAKNMGAKDFVNKSFVDFDQVLSKITALTQEPAGP